MRDLYFGLEVIASKMGMARLNEDYTYVVKYRAELRATMNAIEMDLDQISEWTLDSRRRFKEYYIVKPRLESLLASASDDLSSQIRRVV